MSGEFDLSDLYAARAAEFRPSPVRSVWDIPTDGGRVSLAGGNPDLSGLPLQRLGETASRLIRERGVDVLQYGAGAGTLELREALCSVMRASGIEADPEDVLVTAGSQMGLELVTTMFCDPGDVVLAEAPTYVGAVGTFRGLEAEVVHVECDADGIVPASLEATLARLGAEGKRAKFLYTIPNFTNPSGLTLSAERRAEVLRICRGAGVAVVEDDPYGMIRFAGEPVPPIRTLDTEVIYLGSLSKIFSPGIRIGWVLAPREVRDRLQLACEASTIHASTLSQFLALSFLTEFDWKAHVANSVGKYRARAEAMLAALEEHMPEGTTWTRPDGGFFVWVTLPEGLSADALFDVGVEEGIIFIPGSSFFADGQGERNLRLSFSLETPEAIARGVASLARAIERLQG